MNSDPDAGAEDGAGDSGHRRRRLRAGLAIAAGAVVVLFLLNRLDIGTDRSGQVPDPSPPAAPSVAADCVLGEDSEELPCRIMGAFSSLDEFWAAEAENLVVSYSTPGLTFFDGRENACASAPGAEAPFYCGLDQAIYLDTDTLARLGQGPDGAFTQAYVLAHLWGHHMQDLAGIPAQLAESERRPPQEERLRLELQADCLAGAWAAGASVTVTDPPPPVTDERIEAALTATTGLVDVEGDAAVLETWTAADVDQRRTWLTAGVSGGVDACDTFAVPADDL